MKWKPYAIFLSCLAPLLSVVAFAEDVSPAETAAAPQEMMGAKAVIAAALRAPEANHVAVETNAYDRFLLAVQALEETRCARAYASATSAFSPRARCPSHSSSRPFGRRRTSSAKAAEARRRIEAESGAGVAEEETAAKDNKAGGWQDLDVALPARQLLHSAWAGRLADFASFASNDPKEKENDIEALCNDESYFSAFFAPDAEAVDDDDFYDDW